MSTNNLPKTLTLNLADVEAASRYKTFSAEGFVEVTVVAAENTTTSGKVYENGEVNPSKEKVKRLQQKLDISPLRKPGDFKSVDSSVKLNHYVQLPDVAPDSVEPTDAEEEKDTRGEIVKRLTKTLRCFLGEDEIPTFPRKGTDGKYTYMGEAISKEDVDEAKKDMNKRALEIAYKLWNDPQRWTTPKKKAYAKIRQKVGTDGVARPEIHFFTEKLPKDATLLDYSDWYRKSE
jgi:hypothetical protein